MKLNLFLVSIFLLCTCSQLVYSSKVLAMEPCGSIEFDKSMNCDSPSVKFNISSCDSAKTDVLPATKVTCENAEMVAVLSTEKENYRAVLQKNYNGEWEQKGQVWKVAKEPKSAEQKKSAVTKKTKEDHNIKNPAVGLQKHQVAPSASRLKPYENIQNKNEYLVPEEKAKVASAPVHEKPLISPSAEKKSDEWKFKFGGWLFVEQESFVNLGDNASTVFDSTDPKAKRSDTNLLSNFQFTGQKGNYTLDSILEVGEVFFGDSTTGGNQGLRGKNIEVRNLNVQEEYHPGQFFKIGLFSVQSDPRGFILSDHHAGLQFRTEKESYNDQFWIAKATGDGAAATATQVADTYFGYQFNKKVGKEDQYSLYSVYRTTRETFISDSDLVTQLTGASNYLWAGGTVIYKDSLGLSQIEFNGIAAISQFKADSGQTDSNLGWLVHAHGDKEFGSSWSLGFDGLFTSGSANSRSGSGSLILNRRKNFPSFDPSSAYLMTILTNDGGDDAAGSVRTTTANNPGRLDLDEGLQLGVISLSKTFGDNWEALIRLGSARSSFKRASTNSEYYGDEVDFRIKYKASEMSSWVFEHGIFKPGTYFVKKDEASLSSLKYRLDF